MNAIILILGNAFPHVSNLAVVFKMIIKIKTVNWWL